MMNKYGFLQWLIPLIGMIAVVCIHFGYSEVRMQNNSREIVVLKSDVREISRNQIISSSEVIERLARMEERQAHMEAQQEKILDRLNIFQFGSPFVGSVPWPGN